MSLYIPQLDAYAIDFDGDERLDALAVGIDNSISVIQSVDSGNDSFTSSDISQLDVETKRKYFGAKNGSLEGVNVKYLQRYCEALENHHLEYPKDNPTPVEYDFPDDMFVLRLDPSNLAGSTPRFPNSVSYLADAAEAGFNAGLRNHLMYPSAREYIDVSEAWRNTQETPKGRFTNKQRHALDVELEFVTRKIGEMNESAHPIYLSAPSKLSRYCTQLIKDFLKKLNQTNANPKQKDAYKISVAAALAEWLFIQVSIAETFPERTPEGYWKSLSTKVLSMPENLPQLTLDAYTSLSGTDLSDQLTDGYVANLVETINRKSSLIEMYLNRDKERNLSEDSSGYPWILFEELVITETEVAAVTGNLSGAVDIGSLADRIANTYNTSIPQDIDTRLANNILIN